MKRTEFKNIIREIVSGVVKETFAPSDPTQVIKYINQIWGNSPSVEDIVYYFAFEYGSDADPNLIKTVIEHFKSSPNYYVIKNQN
jgi:hypothetical protein